MVDGCQREAQEGLAEVQLVALAPKGEHSTHAGVLCAGEGSGLHDSSTDSNETVEHWVGHSERAD